MLHQSPSSGTARSATRCRASRSSSEALSAVLASSYCGRFRLGHRLAATGRACEPGPWR